jgi:hypothetical protein
MRESINENLAIENRLLSDENIKIRQAYYDLLADYIKLLQNKMPQNHIDLGRKYWEDRIN